MNKGKECVRQIEFCRIADVQADGTLLERPEVLAQRLARLEAVAGEVRDALLGARHFSGDNDAAVVERPKQLAAMLAAALAADGDLDVERG